MSLIPCDTHPLSCDEDVADNIADEMNSEAELLSLLESDFIETIASRLEEQDSSLLIEDTDKNSEGANAPGDFFDCTFEQDDQEDFEDQDVSVPIPLVVNEGEKLKVNPEAVALLANESRTLAVISIVGRCRTGKSYIMNRLMAGTSRRKNVAGFALGSTIESHTKGIWIWIGTHPKDKNMAVILLDTEGLGDPAKGSNTHDLSIFMLTIMLSSTMIYNTMGMIDHPSLEGLQLAAEMTSHLRTRSDGKDEEMEDFARQFPMLIWAVRDFGLELKHDGNDITADEYLEVSLKRKPNLPKNRDFNGLRDTLLDLFRRRSCFVLPSPTSSSKMPSLDSLPNEDLDPNFLNESTELIDFALDRITAKFTPDGSSPMNGLLFASLIERLVEMLNDPERIISVPSAMESVTNAAHERAADKALVMFAEITSDVVMPTAPQNLTEDLWSAREITMTAYELSVVNWKSSPSHKKKITMSLEHKIDHLTRINTMAVIEFCAGVVEKEFDCMKFDEADYCNDGTLQILCMDINGAKERCLRQAETMEVEKYMLEAVQQKLQPHFAQIEHQFKIGREVEKPDAGKHLLLQQFEDMFNEKFAKLEKRDKDRTVLWEKNCKVVAEMLEDERVKQHAIVDQRNKALIHMNDLTENIRDITKNQRENTKEIKVLREAKWTTNSSKEIRKLDLKIAQKKREKAVLDQRLCDLCSESDRQRRLHSVMSDPEATLAAVVHKWMVIKFNDTVAKPIAGFFGKAKSKMTELGETALS